MSFHFGWNIDTPYFKDRRVRRAMSYAFDHDTMLEKLCYGLYEPCTGNFHETSWMAPRKKTPPYRQDLDKAETLLDEAGWIDHDNDGFRDKELDGKLVPLEFDMLTNQQPLRIAICTLLQENLSQVGVRVNVRPMESTVLQQLTLERKFEAYFGGWGSGTDPDSSENIWATGAGRNFTSYSNPEVDKLYAEGRREPDRSKRRNVRPDCRTALGGSALHMALLAKQLLRIFKRPPRLCLQPSWSLQLFARFWESLDARSAVNTLFNSMCTW